MTIFGDISLDGPRRTVTVEREYATTTADLWSALTEPERLERWLGQYTADGDDGGYRLQMGGGFPVVTGRVLGCEPEKRIVVLWLFSGEAEAQLEADLLAHGDGHVVLTLTHRRAQAVNAAVWGAVWEGVFTHLDGELSGEQGPGDLGDARAMPARLPTPPRSMPRAPRSTAVARPGLTPGAHAARGEPAGPACTWSGCSMPRSTRCGMR